MKKLKIFLLLSLLLCFGFTLSFEVHAQGNGPKIFEVGDVMPLGQVKIQFEHENQGTDYNSSDTITFSGSDKIIFYAGEDDGGNQPAFVEISPSLSTNYQIIDDTNAEDIAYSVKRNMVCWVIIDFSNCSLEERTVTEVSGVKVGYWEDLNAQQDDGPKLFEEDDELPAGYIKISWDFTDNTYIPDKAVTFAVSSGDDVFNDLIIQIDFNFGGYNHLKIFNGGSVEHFNVDTPGFTIITLTESVTIIDLQGTDGITSLDYNVYIGDALTWEVVTQDYLNGFMEAREIYGFRYMGGPWMSGEAAWNHGYDKGSEETWDEGFEYGMETFGYYDPITEQWLSVSEYLDLYGTDKPGQSDFYNNFDKYFIPAMIIVFGGAIVLTILKVFKGRE